uniref:Galectin n=1 Tax=Solen grandis TaxID=165599 RepID=G9IBV0_9BIVA|nr:galectin [Solen grandis]
MMWTELASLILLLIRTALGQSQCVSTDPCLANILSRLQALEKMNQIQYRFNTLIPQQPESTKAPTKVNAQECPCMRDTDEMDVCYTCGESDLCNKMTYAAIFGENQAGNDKELCIPGIVGKDRWINNYAETVEGGIREGSLILVRAYVETGYRFTISIKTGNDSWASDIAFHFNPRNNEGVLVMNSRERGQWQREERIELNKFLPYIFQKRPFEIKIAVSSFGFQVYGNAKKLCFFSHRVDVSRLNTLQIAEHVHVYQDKVMQPVPPMTMHEITMSEEKNVWVLIQMTPTKDDGKIQIFFCDNNTRTSNIHLAFNPRMREKVTIRSGFEKRAWKVEERDQPEFPFVGNETAEVAFLFQQYNIKIYVDRKYYVDFRPRLPISLIRYVYLNGATFYEPEVYYSTPKF